MKQITREQRYQIEAYIESGMSKKFIAEKLFIHLSSIYREIKRNAHKKGGYSAKHALMLADERKERFKRHRKFSNKIERDIRSFIEDEQWSPEQVTAKGRGYQW